MVTAGEGASAPTSSSYGGGGGGAGGKFNRNTHRKSRTTPYDRPPTARRNPSLLSKLVVDPIRNLASSAAHRFFASVTGKRLEPPPPTPLPSESDQVGGDGLGEAAIINEVEAPKVLALDGQNVNTAGTGGISELEQLLKQQTFTRSEIDRLTELLQSKAAESPDGEFKRVEARLSEPEANFETRQQLLRSPLAENGTERERSHAVISTPGISAGVLEDDVASPAELAKAYMGSRPSKVSPSMLGFRSQSVREEAAVLSNVPFTPKSPMISLAPRTTPHVELGGHKFSMTPRSRGRSAIYNMARTPYSRFLPASGKGSVPRRYVNDGFLSPSTQQDQNGEPGSTKSALKRRSAVLDEDLGSVGPMRRIRQKPNLSYKSLGLPTTRGIGGVSDSLAQKSPLMDEWKHKSLKTMGENEDNGGPSTSYAYVPPKSSEMAAKILQHLEKMTPKEKSAESKLIIAKEKSPAKLTTDMLHGQALRSLEDTNSPKLLEGTQGTQRLSYVSQSSLTPVHDYTLQKEERTKENGPEKINFQNELSTQVMNGNFATSVKDTVASTEGSDAAAKLVSQRPQKKRAFMMSAHEDSFDLDEDTYANGPVPDALAAGKGKPETSGTDHSLASAGNAVQDATSSLPEMKKLPVEPIFGRPMNSEVHSATVVGGEKIGVAFPALQTSSANPPSETIPLTMSTFGTIPSTISTFEKPKQANDKSQATHSSPVPSANDLSAPKPISWIQPSLESANGFGPAVPSLRVPASDKHDDNKAPDGLNLRGEPETIHSSPFSSPSASVASFVVPGNSNLKNGPLGTSSSAILSTSAQVSTGVADQTPAAGTSSSSSANTTNFATATWSSGTSSSSLFGSAGAPVFQFGSPANPSTAISSSVTTSVTEPAVVKSNTDREAKTGILGNIPSGGSSFAMTGTGSSIFGLSPSSAASTAKSQTESTASGFVFGLQSSDVGTGASTVSQNSPFQFGSSASSPVFGTSGVSSFTSSNSLFSSSAPPTKVLGSGSSFSLSTSTSSAETKSVDPGSGPSSGIFNFGAGSSAASSGASAFSLSSGTPNTFVFGASSSATSSSTSSVGSSSSTTPAIFSFGASSSSGTSMISSSAAGTNSGVFGASGLSSPAVTNTASSSAATSVPFGSGWQIAKSSPFGASSSSSPSPVFSFGASSSSANTAPVVFGSSTAASSGPGFSFTTATATTSLSQQSPFTISPMFGSSTCTFPASGNNDQMSMEDSMAEDVQAPGPTPAAPVFGQLPVSPSPGGFAFGSAAPPSASPFQFGGQQSQGAIPNPSPFQATGSMEFNAGGSFSLGSGSSTVDKSGRRIIRPKSSKNRKK